MSRIRSLHPGWRTSETLRRLDDSARTLSAALITLADCYGNGDAAIPLLASETWDINEDDEAQVLEVFAKTKLALHKLWISGYVDLYTVGSRLFFHLPSFPKFNKPRNPHREVPGPEQGKIKELPAGADSVRIDSGHCPDIVRNDSGTVPESVGNGSGQCPPLKGYGIGLGKGKGIGVCPAPVGAHAHVAADVPRSKKLTALLRKWGEPARELWEYQERLRAETIPRSRRLEPTDERLGRVCARLEAGATPDDCRAVLDGYAGEARRGSAKWFNGTTNWREKGFEYALGSAGSEHTGRIPLTAADILDLAEQLERIPAAEDEFAKPEAL